MFGKIYHQDIRYGEVFNTIVDGRKIGKSVYSGLFVGKKQQKIVLSREERRIRCYAFTKENYVIDDRGLVIRNVKEIFLSDLKKEVADKLLKGRGL